MSEAAVALKPQGTTETEPTQVAPDALRELRAWHTVQHEATREQMYAAWKRAYHMRHGSDALPARVSHRAETAIDDRLASLYDALFMGHAYLHTSERDLLNALSRSAQASVVKIRSEANAGRSVADLLPSARLVIGHCYSVLLTDYMAHLDSWLAPRVDEIEVF